MSQDYRVVCRGIVRHRKERVWRGWECQPARVYWVRLVLPQAEVLQAQVPASEYHQCRRWELLVSPM